MVLDSESIGTAETDAGRCFDVQAEDAKRLASDR